MTDTHKWILTEIHLESFLGVGAGGLTIGLDRPVTVLLGPSGAGKSTIVTAVEWALFGAIETFPDYSISGVGENASTYRSVIHLGQSAATVRLTFHRGDCNLVWTRKRSKGKPRPTDDTVTCLIDGSDTQADPRTVFGLDSSLYNRGVAPKQSTIRNLVHNERADRNESLDHLFGIEPLNDLSVGFSKGHQEIGRRVGDLITRYESISTGLKGPIREQFDRRMQSRQVAINAGVSKDQLNQKAAWNAVTEISTEMGETPPDQNIPLETLKAKIQSLGNNADRLWANPGPQGKLERLNNIFNALPKARTDWQNAIENAQKSRDNLSELVKTVGDRDTVGTEILAANEKLTGAISALADASSKASVLERAQVWYSEHSHDPDLDCPVCQRPTESSVLAEAIDSSLQLLRGADGTIERLEGGIKTAQESKAQLEGNALKLDNVAAEIDRSAAAVTGNQVTLLKVLSDAAALWEAASNLDDNEVTVSDLLQAFAGTPPVEPVAPDKLDTSLRDLISEVTQSRVDTLNEVEQAGNSAERIRTRIAALQRLIEFLEDDQKMSDMDIILSDPNLADASAGIEAAKTVESIVKTLAEVAGEVSNDEANKITNSLSDPLNRWFERISRHDMLKKAVVTAHVRRAGGIVRNTYEIRATDTASSNHVPAGHNLSGGYEMVLAVSALCAIQELASLNHSIGLFILDEPTESLDPELVETMGASLGLHAPGDRTIITTNRPEFAKVVLDSAGAARGKIVNLEPWTVNDGTRVGI